MDGPGGRRFLPPFFRAHLQGVMESVEELVGDDRLEVRVPGRDLPGRAQKGHVDHDNRRAGHPGPGVSTTPGGVRIGSLPFFQPVGLGRNDIDVECPISAVIGIGSVGGGLDLHEFVKFLPHPVPVDPGGRAFRRRFGFRIPDREIRSRLSFFLTM